MSAEEEQPVWYVRRSTTIQGPYPVSDIQRYLLLGRLRLSDRVSLDARGWEPLTQHPELIPDGMRDLGSEEGRARFEADRRAVDERRSEREVGEVGEDAGPPAAGRRDRRSRWWRGSLPAAAGLLGLIALLVGIGYYRDFESGVVRGADCVGGAGTGTVWNGCVKDGLDLADGAVLTGLHAINVSLREAGMPEADLAEARLDYADLTGAELTHVNLRGAILRGASLENANLKGADLRRADLRNADLRGARIGGARFEGAMLGNALWIDGRSCAPDAVGACSP